MFSLQSPPRLFQQKHQDSFANQNILQKLMPRLVNLQALIDREIILDTLIQNFSAGDSIVQYAMQLWFLIVKLDIQYPEGEQHIV